MASLATFRAETRGWLEENCPPIMRTPAPADETVWGGREPTWKFPEQKLWMDRMAARGWTLPTCPKQYGGGGLSLEQAEILAEEMNALGCRAPLRAWARPCSPPC